MADVPAPATPLDLPTSICDASDMLTAFVVKITDALKGVDVLQHMATFQQSVVGGTMADLTMVGVGVIMVLLPVFFSSKWIEVVTVILSILFGIAGASYVVETMPTTAALVDSAPRPIAVAPAHTPTHREGLTPSCVARASRRWCRCCGPRG